MVVASVSVVIEVTNTLRAPSVTGYQRLVREVLRELSGPGSPALEVLPVVWDGPGRCYRRLTAGELRSLRELPAPATAPVRRPLTRRVLGRVGRTPLGARVRTQLSGGRERKALRLRQLPEGSLFFDVEPAWHNPAARDRLLPQLRAEGISVVTLIADVLPESHPEWFEPRVVALFHQWLQAHLRSSQLCLTISSATRTELLAVGVRDGLVVPPQRVLPLGADFGATPVRRPVQLPAGLDRYLLVVSTLEPRKNQALAVSVLDALAVSHPGLGLVLVGKQGWLVDDTAERIRTHPLYGSRLLWLTGIGDDELVWLYRNAFLALVPSFSEGLGLPVLEALRQGVPTIASTGGALPEAGGEFAEYAAADDPDAWVALVTAHLTDPVLHEQARARLDDYQAPTWAAAGQALRLALGEVAAQGRRLS